jgi:hypothetical protein
MSLLSSFTSHDVLDLADLEDVAQQSTGDSAVEADHELVDALRKLLVDLGGDANELLSKGFERLDVDGPLIRDTYFVDYAKQLAEDIGAVPETYTWPTSCIDWEKAADDLANDYTQVEIAGVTYYVRLLQEVRNGTGWPKGVRF